MTRVSHPMRSVENASLRNSWLIILPSLDYIFSCRQEVACEVQMIVRVNGWQ
ncbi:hypothetical protein P153DRAFT_367542 [Dothidotthia symphoricarpi CBS 119687]|uniref:Uncharacterized protein n=1 Tax=Dothidotthia symphoricarpi CBS 119687 TaxID=1392245 RepID=A0A6A6AB01_9PLEO|nr:uncharacterized protein P153DRAFT_367542 [Dothidotthia symphoricarpi CBS 119687]KAF2128393.1 hypothetical protein P153DRAFT_367542 [Dothidotthia symphoricarpi CBS 119687]